MRVAIRVIGGLHGRNARRTGKADLGGGVISVQIAPNNAMEPSQAGRTDDTGRVVRAVQFQIRSSPSG